MRFNLDLDYFNRKSSVENKGEIISVEPDNNESNVTGKKLETVPDSKSKNIIEENKSSNSSPEILSEITVEEEIIEMPELDSSITSDLEMPEEIKNNPESSEEEKDLAIGISEEEKNKIEIKKIKELSGLSEEKIEEWYPKMKTEKYDALKLLKAVMEFIPEEDKNNKSVLELIEVFKGCVTDNNLARVVTAFIVLIERGEVDEVLVKKEEKSEEKNRGLEGMLADSGIASSH